MLIELLSTTIKTCLILLPILVTLVLVKLVLLPLKRMRELRRPDASFYFFPLTGFNRYMRRDLQTKGDILYSVKNFKENHPGKRFQVTNMGSSTTILLRDSELIREFVNKPAFYEKIHVFRTMSLLTGNGLAFSEGDVWKAHRKIVSSCFHYEFLTNNISNIMGIVNEFLDKIPPQGEKNFPIVSKMQEITGDVIGRLFFGEKLSSYTFKGKGLTLALASLGSQLGLRAVSPGVLLFGPKLLKVPFIPQYRRMMQDITDFRKLCFQIVQDRKAHPEKSSKDLLGTLLEAQQSGLHPEQCLSDEDIVDEFITFYFAGMDTTAHLVSMVFYNLTQHPEYLKVLKEERDKTYNISKTNENLQKMDQLHAFLKETLRVSSPAPGVTFRVAKADHKLLDVDIKKGDILRTDFYALFMDEKNFKNASQFDPNRWNDPNLKLDSFAFTPFSAGPRNCIGQHLAILESKLIISEFLERFDFKLKDGYNLKMTSRFLYEPVDPVVFELTPATK